jgi:hypothetical protein
MPPDVRQARVTEPDIVGEVSDSMIQ